MPVRLRVDGRSYTVALEASWRLRLAVNGLVLEASGTRDGAVTIEVRGRLGLRELAALARLLPGLLESLGEAELSLYGAKLVLAPRRGVGR